MLLLAFVAIACDADRDDAGTGGPASVAASSAQASSSSSGSGGSGAGGAPSSCTAMPADACYSCCGDLHSGGRDLFESEFPSCCGGCAIDCMASLCGGAPPPDFQCAACAQSAVGMSGTCTQSDAFQQGCLADGACAAFVSCFTNCLP